MQGVQDPRDAALGAFISPRSAAAHPAGLSPADKTYLGQLQDQAQSTENATREAVQMHRDAVDAFAQQSDALSTESQVGALAFQHDLKENEAHRAQLVAETKERQTKIDAKLAEVESQGVNPNQYWESMGTGQKIGAAIAIGLGAFGAQLGHGQNTALEIINNAISANIDAQKTNLQKGLEVMKMESAENEKGFGMQEALLRAERDSVQSAYTIAQNDVTRRMGLVKDNADFTTRGQQLIQGLQASRDERVAHLNEQLYALNKRAETPVGGGESAAAKKIRELSEKIYTDSKGQVTVAEARRQAANLVLGVDVKPGEATTSWAPAGKAPGALSPRLARRAAELDANEQGLVELDKLLRKGTGFSKSDRERVDQQVEELKGRGVKIPEGALDFSTNTTARRAGIAQALLGVRAERDALVRRGAGSGGEGESDNPAGGEKEEE